jgi:NTE family protein
MVSIGLVLGAGGVLGGAYHAGALAALDTAVGWDARTADLIVGTSAGANTAASLRGGLSAADHLARALDDPLSPAGTALTAGSPGRIRLPEPHEAGARPPWRSLPQAPWLLGPAFLRPGRARWGVALAGLMPEGQLPTTVLGDRIRPLHPDRWPGAPTWIVAYRTGDARRVVFGRDDVDVPDLATAVEASSAVPGRFRPIRLASGRYVDGAVHSPSNADLVAGLGFDLVVVSSPMTSAPGVFDTGDAMGTRARAWFAGLLQREVAIVTGRDTPVLCLEPSRRDLALLRSDGPDDERVAAVAESAYQSVLDLLDHGLNRSNDQGFDPAVAAALELLGPARSDPV